MIVNTAEGASLDSSSVGWGETHQNLLSSLSAGSPPKQPVGQDTKTLKNSWMGDTLLRELKSLKKKNE